MMREGTIVHATLTKNKDKKRDPEIHQSKKGNDWHFGLDRIVIQFNDQKTYAHGEFQE